MNEMPQLVASSYSSATIDPRMWTDQQITRYVPGMAGLQQADVDFKDLVRRAAAAQTAHLPANHPKGVAAMAAPSRRLVQVFIADPDENVPLSDCLLYRGDQKLTDLTDQELFFEVDIKSILDAHNQKRVALVNKAVKERTENLEPARIRDLKMTVVTIAQF